MKVLIDEDLSPAVARYLCEECLIDAVAVRDRELLGAPDYKVLEYAFQEDRILITANVRDFECFAKAREVHAGIVLMMDGDLLRTEQIDVVKQAIAVIEAHIETGQDMINQVLYISVDGTQRFESLPKS
jgi:predicted nuclease of predicted toxin-antitoxin system